MDIDILAPDWLQSAMDGCSIKTGQLAAESGVSRSQIQRIRNGDPARTDTLKKLREGIERIKAAPPPDVFVS